MYVKRIIPIENELKKNSILLLGPRRTGKSSFIRNQVPKCKIYDLLKSDVFLRLSQRPSLIRESLENDDHLVIIDEIQKLPSLMDEVHVMIEEFGIRFLMTGSSARKLKRTHTSLMAGRARTRRLFPFVYPEIENFDLSRALSFGTLPPIYSSDEPEEDLVNYAGTYLREEIQAEALSRNIESFSRFLARAALYSSEIINFEAVGRDAQVSARTIRQYYSVLEDTLVGTMLSPLATTGKRKAISRGKFYFFDIGVVHALTGEFTVPEETPSYGKAFEHFIWQELFAYHNYFARKHPIQFWRDTNGAEVDFILGTSVAIEVKAARIVHDRHLKGLMAITEQDDYDIRRKIVVCREPQRRKVHDIEILPYRDFLQELWSQNII